MTTQIQNALDDSNSSLAGAAHSHGSLVASVQRWARDTPADPVPALARVVSGVVLFPHGAQHLFGWFGGYGFDGTFAWMTGTLGIPAPVAAFAIVFELAGAVLLSLGLFGRFVALGLAVFLSFAATTHAANGFFMNWLGNQQGEGFEYHLLAVALLLVVVARGSGSYSLDRLLSRRG